MKATLISTCTVLGLASINLSQNPLTELEKYQLRQLVSELEDSISGNTSNEFSLSRVIESIDAVFKKALLTEARRIRKPASRRTMKPADGRRLRMN